MSIRPTARAVCLTLGLAGAALGLATQSANAVPVSLNTWYEFAFNGPGSALSSGIGAVPATNAPD